MTQFRLDFRADPTDIAAGAAIIVACSAFAVGGWIYGIGTISRMGPGFFPFSAAMIGLVLGGIIVAVALVAPAKETPAVMYRPLLFISAAFVAFAASIDIAGLLPATFFAVALAALADKRTKPWEACGLALSMAAFTWLIFIVLLDLPISPIGGT
ncbi:tripartite tricarboxylate transporter TctB family protein [Pelagibacterium halotolerans]|uniref:tripartite tricarboxylate transporter TctB family protein n=1 Tax=Pelagibacterium halotolerans TaxID=531813 RepID=UPI0013051303|nr:tripartite tricarboxylate transporter TctB family protein [Pelagibacterium halotolerans]QJR19800.1 tripartite tricarboxylate transporter TctB family protein [Pelagibacterium halotolerans]